MCGSNSFKTVANLHAWLWDWIKSRLHWQAPMCSQNFDLLRWPYFLCLFNTIYFGFVLICLGMRYSLSHYAEPLVLVLFTIYIKSHDWFRITRNYVPHFHCRALLSPQTSKPRTFVPSIRQSKSLLLSLKCDKCFLTYVTNATISLIKMLISLLYILEIAQLQKLLSSASVPSWD